MAIDTTTLIQALIDGGISPAASKVIANAIANATTPLYSQSRDVNDVTPTETLRLIDSDARRYVLTNLDYSSEAPYQKRLSAKPGQYGGGPEDHPYKDSQPVAPVPPLSTPAVQSGDGVTVRQNVEDNSAINTVSLKFGIKSGSHMRYNAGTQAIDTVPITVACPQGLVVGTITETTDSTNLELSVRQLESRTVVRSDGTTAGVFGWPDSTVTSTTIFSSWAQANLMLQTSTGGVLTMLGFAEWVQNNLINKTSAASVVSLLGLSSAPAYSAGDWTPRYVNDAGGAVASTLTYSAQLGKYVKINNLVWVTGRLTVATIAGQNGFSLAVAGLPFPVINATEYHSIASVGYRNQWITIGPTNLYFFPGSSRAHLTTLGGGAAINFPNALNNMQNGTDMIFSGHYYTDS